MDSLLLGNPTQQKQNCGTWSVCLFASAMFFQVGFVLGIVFQLGRMETLENQKLRFNHPADDFHFQPNISLLVSMHGNPHNGSNSYLHGGNDILAYNIGQIDHHSKHVLNGNLHAQSLFGHKNLKHVNEHELRDLVIVPKYYLNGLQYTLYAVNSFKRNSMILKYDDACALQQPGLSVWARADMMIHPYGIAVADGAVFVTCQDSGQLIQFPMDDVFSPKVLGQMQQPRAVAASPELHRIFVAERFGTSKYSPANKGRIWIFDSLTGHLIDRFPFVAPIGMAMVGDKYLMIGCNQTHKVYAFDPMTLQQKRVFQHADLIHPSGIAVYGTRMFVISQQTKRIFEFDVVSGHGKTIVEDLPGPAEGIAVLPCIPQSLSPAEGKSIPEQDGLGALGDVVMGFYPRSAWGHHGFLPVSS